MNFLWLDDFLVLAETGNFSRAAEERHLTQPAFSRRVRALEEWLGTELFDRSGQPATLTPAGEWFGTVARELRARVDRIPADARAVNEADAATLRLAATHALSFTFLPRWLRTLESRVALGPVQLMSDLLPRCELLLSQGKVQFVLSHAHPEAANSLDNSGALSTQVGADALVPVSARGARGRARHVLGKSAAAPVPLLAYSQESGLGRIAQAVLGRRLDALAPKVVFTAHLASVLRTMALDGRGIAWLPRTLIDEDIAAGTLVPAGGEECVVPLQVRLYRGREPMGTAVEAFWKAAHPSSITSLHTGHHQGPATPKPPTPARRPA